MKAKIIISKDALLEGNEINQGLLDALKDLDIDEIILLGGEILSKNSSVLRDIESANITRIGLTNSDYNKVLQLGLLFGSAVIAEYTLRTNENYILIAGGELSTEDDQRLLGKPVCKISTKPNEYMSTPKTKDNYLNELRGIQTWSYFAKNNKTDRRFYVPVLAAAAIVGLGCFAALAPVQVLAKIFAVSLVTQIATVVLSVVIAIFVAYGFDKAIQKSDCAKLSFSAYSNSKKTQSLDLATGVTRGTTSVKKLLDTQGDNNPSNN